jgi:hypothetical protein
LERIGWIRLIALVISTRSIWSEVRWMSIAFVPV